MKVVELPAHERGLSAPVPAPGLVGFDYAGVDSSTADRLKRAAEEIRSCQRIAVSTIIEIGVNLLGVKAYLDHGQFGSWLRAEFGWSERTAQNYMRVADVFQAKSETVADLPPSFIYKLAAPSTPRKIREKVVADLEAGQRIDCLGVTTEIEQSRPSKLLDKVRRFDKVVQEANAILGKLAATERDRLLQLLGIPGVIDRLNDGRSSHP